MEDDPGTMPRPHSSDSFIIKQLCHDKCKLNPIIYTHPLDNTKHFTNRKILEGAKSSKSNQFNLNFRTSSDAIVTYRLVLRSVVAKIYVSLAKFAVFFHRKELNRIEQCTLGHVSLF